MVVGAGRLTTQVAQVALLARLVILFALTLLWTAQGRGGATPAIAVAAGASYVLMRSARVRAFLGRHPLAVLADVTLVASLVGMIGPASPFALALCTSALLVGLWLPVLPGFLVLSTLMTYYLALLSERPVSADGITAYVIVLPALFVTLWGLGLTVHRAAQAEANAQGALREAIAAAATGLERGRIAREMHDTVAKSHQAMAFTAASVQANVAQRPDIAARRAAELATDATRTIGEVRALMQELRDPPSVVPFADLVAQTIEEWRSRTGIDCTVDIEPVDVTDSLVRYEGLMCLAEALENVYRHAGACKVAVRLSAAQDQLRVEVSDTGRGADPNLINGPARRGHFGVVGMRERMSRVGGDLRIETGAGRGTTVSLTVHRHGLIESMAGRVGR